MVPSSLKLNPIPFFLRLLLKPTYIKPQPHTNWRRTQTGRGFDGQSRSGPVTLSSKTTLHNP